MNVNIKKETESITIELIEQNKRGDLLNCLDLLKKLYKSTCKFIELKKVTSLIFSTRVLGEMILHRKYFDIRIDFKEFGDIPVTQEQKDQLFDTLVELKTKQFRGYVNKIINELQPSNNPTTSINKMLDSIYGEKGTETRTKFTKQATELHNKANVSKVEALEIKYEDAVDTNDRFEKYIEELNGIIQKSNASDEDKALSKDYTNGLNRT